MPRLFPALLAIPLIACGVDLSGAIQLSDDVGPDDSEEAIHLPYARGSVVRIGVQGWNSGRVDDGWSLEASDELILVPLFETEQDDTDEESDESFSVEFRAFGEGTTTLTLFDGEGEIRDEATVEVVMPDAITLHVATSERMGMPELAPEDCDVSIVEGGTGGLIAQYWLGETEVFGNEILDLASEDPVVLDVDYSYNGKNLDWLQLTPEEVGSHAVELFVDGEPLHTMTYEAVPAEAVATTAVLGGDESEAEEGDWINLLLQTFDADDCPIYGANWNWTVDGEFQEDQGDLYHYEFDEGIVTSLEASFGDHQQTATVHGVGTIQSSNAAGCSAFGGAAALAPALLGLLALVRRRED